MQQLGKHEYIEDLGIGGLTMIQDETLMKFGTDAVLLSNFIRLSKGEHLVEFGTGTGILPLLLSDRVEAPITALEIQEKPALLATRNMALNGLGSVQVIHGDLKDATKLVKGHVDVVAANPPYDKLGSGEAPQNEAHLIARYEAKATLEDVAKNAAKLLKDGGRFYMIHRTTRLAEIFSVLRDFYIEPKQIRFVRHKVGHEAKLVLIYGVKRGGVGLHLLNDLILHEDDGTFTEEAKKIYHMESER